MTGPSALNTDARCRQQRLWNLKDDSYPLDKTLFGLFEEQVGKTPERCALVFEDTAGHIRQWTYGEVNEQANRIAHALREHCQHTTGQALQPDSLIALYFDRCPETIINILAVLKAGAAYIPLSPEYPPARARIILEDSGAKMVLTRAHLYARMAAFLDGLETVPDVIDADNWPLARNARKSNLRPISGAENLAYLFFTSGSTGKPKGVLIEHRSVVNTLSAMREVYDFSGECRKTSCYSDYVFDVSVSEIFNSLCFGGELHFYNETLRSNVDRLADYIIEHELNYVFLPPAILSILPRYDYPSIKAFIFAGEPCEQSSCLYWADNYALYNYYGPTEATIYASGKRALGPNLNEIGRPIRNVSLYVLDQHMRPVPAGKEGELYIGGAGLARAYLNMPELTAERFVENIFASDAERTLGYTRLYKTGDLVRWRLDQNGDPDHLEFIGRNDCQVKVRGLRIELGEIETVLAALPGIKQAIVVAKGNYGSRFLAAYLVTENGLPLDCEYLRTEMGEVLPDYMVPDTYHFLSRLPLTQNGKVDRRALPEPRFFSGERHVAPRNEFERKLRRIWQQILGLETIGINDSYFRIGGNSLSAVRLGMLAQRELGMGISVAELFEHKTIAQLAGYLAGKQRSSDYADIPRLNETQKKPLSFAQERLLIADQLGSEGSAYHVYRFIRLQPGLQKEHWEQAIRLLIKRHPILRTVYRIDNKGNAYQQTLDDTCRINETERSEFENDDAITETLRRHIARPFDLSRDAAMRVHFYRVQQQLHLLFIWHHIAIDGWSLDNFFRELGAIVQATEESREPRLPELPIEYSDYAIWQRRNLRGERLERLLKYWERQLAGYEPLSLPIDYSRPPRPNLEGRDNRFELSAELSAALRGLAQEEECTLYSVLLSAFVLTMATLSGQDDIVVGSPSDDRQHPQSENLIGVFVNMLAMRIELDRSLSIAELIARVKSTVAQAMVHRELPFDTLVERLGVERELSRHALFQVVFGVQHFGEGQDLPFTTVNASDRDSLYSSAKFDLSVIVNDSDRCLKLEFNYAAALFRESTIERAAEIYRRVLGIFISNRMCKLCDIDLLSTDEKYQQARLWNRTDSPLPRTRTLADLFDEQVNRNAARTALRQVQTDGTLSCFSYGELKSRAELLAKHIQSRLGPDRDESEIIVGLLAERSCDAIIAMLSLTRLGHAYLPLDPRYPTARLQAMLDEADSPLVLASRGNESAARSLWGNREILFLDELPAEPGPQWNWQDCHFGPDRLAYLMYTSGSTGKPKGVMIEQRAIVRLARNTASISFKPEDQVLLTGAMVFDATTWEIWGSLLNGATLNIVSETTLLDSELLSTALRELRITTLFMTTQLFNKHVEQLPDMFSGVEQLMVGGETLSVDHITSARKANPQLAIVNGYGPTENTTLSVCYRVPVSAPIVPAIDVAETASLKSIPIGLPIDNSTAYVVNAEGRLLPPGVCGELWVGGEGLARGYLKRTKLNAEKFIADPFSEQTGARVYKTGDRVRWNNDGLLEFHGRADRQTKIRGYRVEPEEIERIIIAVEGIKQALVQVRESGGRKYLAAYLVSGKDVAPRTSVLRKILTACLPEYMLPDTYTFLESLPLTLNGKIDYRALPEPDFGLGDTYVAPREPLEKELCSIWQSLLGIEQVGVDDNFFRIGGNSMMAVRLTALARRELGAEIPLALLFEHKTVAGLADVLRQNLNQSGGRRDADGEIPARCMAKAPLSFSQERLLFFDQFEQASAAYLIPFLFQLSADADLQLIEQAVNLLVDRHAILRTVYQSGAAGEYSQVLFDRPNAPLGIGRKTPSRDTQLADALAEAITRPFDLSCEPSMRVSVFSIEMDRYLLFVWHHIAFDGWSREIFLREFGQLYAALASGSVIDWPALEISYSDYALWQREKLQGKYLDKLISYWQGHLQGFDSLALPTDSPRPPKQDYRGGNFEFELDADLSDDLRQFAKAQETSLFTVLLSGFYLTLAILSGRRDIVVGTPSDNRQHTQIQSLIGFFVNTLALRAELDFNNPVDGLIQQIHGIVTQAQVHQDLPFEKLVELLNVERDGSRHPVFQVMFSLESDDTTKPRHAQPFKPVDLKNELAIHTPAKFDLSLAIIDGESICGAFTYALSLFGLPTVAKAAAVYRRVLREFVNDPQLRICELAWLEEDEKQELLETPNRTDVDYPREFSLAHCFEEQVRRSAERIALSGRQRDGEAIEWSYRQLNGEANALAYRIREKYADTIGRQLTPDTLVALYLEKSPELVVGILAVLKAGAAWLPLSTDYPEDRSRVITEDADVPIILTSARLLGSIRTALAGSRCKPEFVLIDDGGNQRFQSAENPQALSSGRDLAYVLYTSGSTGMPKGVLIEQHSVINLVGYQSRVMNIDAGEKILWLADAVFDASVEQLFLALLNGANLCIPDPETIRDPACLCQKIVEWGITHLHATPTYLSVLGHPGEGHSLRRVISGGESCLPVLRRIWGELLINKYGPTETTVTALECLDYHAQARVNCIGRPIGNTRVYVLSAERKVLPAGVPGELYIGGAGVARGYLGRADLTASQFIDNPFATDGCRKRGRDRLYRSGDIVRWLLDADGHLTNLEFIGRVDQQVKIRGFRIELDEIREVLQAHDNVREALVQLHHSTTDEKCLVAWVTLENTRQKYEDITAELRGYIRSRLPSYMLPSAFMVINAMPLTVSGKVDRRALPQPNWHDQQSNFAAPAGISENLLAEIWSELLNRDGIGRLDNFFDKGGHSLLAIRLVSKINQVFAVTLTIADIFEYQILNSQAKAIEQARASREAGQGSLQALPAVTAVSRDQALTLSYAQQRLWFLSQYMGPTAVYNIAHAWRIRADLNVKALIRSLVTIVERHESLRTRIVVHNGNPVQLIDVPVCDIEVETVASMADLQVLCRSERNYPFDLTRDTLCRLRLLRDDSGRDGQCSRVLLLTLHHSISDGWSTEIFLRELESLYRAFDRDEDSSLQPLPVQYADYAAWQRQWMQGPALESQFHWWREQLADLPPLLTLPADRPRPMQQSYRGACLELRLPEALFEQLKSLSRVQGVTLYMSLLSAFAVLLGRYADQDDVAIGTPVANRLRPETEALIGFFSNTLVMRCRLESNPRFSDLLRQTREAALQAYMHQDMPFELLIEKLNPLRSTSFTPLFQVMFSLQNMAFEQGDSALGMEELRFNDEQSSVSHFDLSLLLRETQTGIDGVMEFNTDLFDHATVARMLRHFEALLEEIALSPDQRISEYDFLSDEEKSELIMEVDEEPSALDTQLCIHEMVEAQAAASPDSSAVVAETRNGSITCLSYSELNGRANVLANELVDAGWGCERYVGICIEHSPEMLIAVLATMKSGAAYVPLDPVLPRQRLALLIEDIGIELVITRTDELTISTLSDVVDEASGAGTIRFLIMDEVIEKARGVYPGDPHRAVPPGSQAYVIYTSGSTGRPKGTMVEHRTLANHLQAVIDRYDIEQSDVLVLFASLNFDAALEQIFCALCTGARLHLRPQNLWDEHSFAPWLLCHGITTIDLVPGYALEVLPALFANADFWPRTGLKRIIIGGEAFPRRLVECWRDRGLEQQCRLFNAYGPTEACITSHLHEISVADGDVPSVPLGTSAGHGSTLILDRRQSLVPRGVTGELCIGGARLARAYLRRPALTAEKFIPNPFSTRPGERLYRSGDKVRRIADGAIEFVGRADDQVKIRGFRIELAEIEQVLLQSGGLREVVVLARKDDAGTDQLVAWVAGERSGDRSQEASPAGSKSGLDEQDDRVLVNELRDYARLCLPAYMVPAAFVVLDALPLTENGKIDKKALPTPRIVDFSEYVAPRTETEQALVAIWNELLSVKSLIGVKANFFDLGGHSLLATRMISLINVKYAVDILLREIFAVQTLEKIAEIIDLRLSEGQLSRKQRVNAFHDDSSYEMEEFEL